jgi:hypothetical protein
MHGDMNTDLLKRDKQMKKMMLIALLTMIAIGVWAADDKKPWDNGKLKVSDNQRFLMHENGTPFFWQ